MRSIKTFYLARVSLFSAIALIVAMFEFPIIFFPAFYKLDLSEAITLIAGFSLGPMGGFLTELMKTILIVIIKGSLTIGIGEFANFTIGIALVVPAAYIYKKNRTFKGAILGMALGSLCFIAVSAFLNYFILFPLYIRIYGISERELIDIAKVANANIVDMKSIILFATVPYNVLKAVLSCLVSVLIYKKLSFMINKVYNDKV